MLDSCFRLYQALITLPGFGIGIKVLTHFDSHRAESTVSTLNAVYNRIQGLICPTS